MANLTIQSETTRINFIEYIGDTVLMQFAYKDADGVMIDLLNTTVSMEIRRDQLDAVPIASFSSTDGSIDITGTEANIKVIISATQSATFLSGDYFYFIATETDGFVNTLITGKIIMKVR
jgi:hypothetical protein